MRSVNMYLAIAKYSDGISTMTNAIDLILAEEPLDEEHIDLLNTAKLKFTCVGMLIKKGYYDEAFILDDDARIDMIFILSFLGLNVAANTLIEGLLNDVV